FPPTKLPSPAALAAGDAVFKPSRSGSRPMPLNLFAPPRVSLIALTVVWSAFNLPPAVAGDLSDFKSPLDNSPMTFPLQPGEVETPAVKSFKATGVNAYRDDADAIADGKK